VKDWSQVLGQTKNNIHTLRKIFTETAKNGPPRQAQAIHQALDLDSELEKEGISAETRGDLVTDSEAVEADQLLYNLKKETIPCPEHKPKTPLKRTI